MTKTFFISDTHFFSSDIIVNCHRPWTHDMNGIFAMNNEMIKRWNSVVHKEDTVYHLGDFACTDYSVIPDIVKSLNGSIKLVMGNHDFYNFNTTDKYKNNIDFFYQAGFTTVYDTPIVINDFFILSHKPAEWLMDRGAFANIFGHVHNNPAYKHYSSRSFNCSVEMNNYTPVSFETIIEKMNSLV